MATDEQPATDAKPQYTVVVRIAFIADGQQIASTEAQGQLSLPAEGDTQLINIPLDARAFAEGFVPALAALAMQDAAKEAREQIGKPVAVNGPALVGADGTPLVRQ